MSKFVCKYCGSGLATYAHKGPHVGEWCSSCQRWIRWVPKQEINMQNNTVERELSATCKTVDDITVYRKDYEEGLEDELPWD